jgi:hypothetical protein
VLLTAIAHPPGTEAPALLPTPLMLALHAVGTLVAALLLTKASTAFAVVAAALTGLVRALVVLLSAAEAPQRTPTAPASRVDALIAVLLRRVCGRRGPPVPA